MPRTSAPRSSTPESSISSHLRRLQRPLRPRHLVRKLRPKPLKPARTPRQSRQRLRLLRPLRRRPRSTLSCRSALVPSPRSPVPAVKPTGPVQLQTKPPARTNYEPTRTPRMT
ncbi:MAG: hypothetical protein EBT22_09760 [Chloroflexi bacterium]|nr:hypothetical protein [Chloroflexota bacterium]